MQRTVGGITSLLSRGSADAGLLSQAGEQDANLKSNEFFAWAVSSGDIGDVPFDDAVRLRLGAPSGPSGVAP